MLRNLLFTLSFLCSTLACAGEQQYIDLTHDYSANTLTWPGSAPFNITNETVITEPTYVTVRDYASNEHTGTHMDAPRHFAKGHSGVDNIPLNNLIGPAIKVTVNPTHPDYQINIQDFEQWEKTYGKIPAGTIILLNTGYAKYWGNMQKYSGKNASGLHFPGLDPHAATWLIQERKIKAIGIDTFSIDYGQTKTFPSHQILTKYNIPVFENVGSMQELPSNNFTVYALPMKIQNGTGAPVRIVAVAQ